MLLWKKSISWLATAAVAYSLFSSVTDFCTFWEGRLFLLHLPAIFVYAHPLSFSGVSVLDLFSLVFFSSSHYRWNTVIRTV
jgi:hypothetical protein